MRRWKLSFEGGRPSKKGGGHYGNLTDIDPPHTHTLPNPPKWTFLPQWLIMTYTKWCLSELGLIMIMYDHVSIIVGPLCMNLWYFGSVLTHLESCHCQESNLSQSSSNLSQSSSIYLSHVYNWEKLEVTENYCKWLTVVYRRFRVT